MKANPTEPMLSEAAAENGSKSKPRVLLVDDDARLLDALRRGLSFSGVDITTAEEAGQALNCVESGWPHVVVLGIIMPRLDGPRLCPLLGGTFPVRGPILTAP